MVVVAAVVADDHRHDHDAHDDAHDEDDVYGNGYADRDDRGIHDDCSGGVEPGAA